MKLIGAIFLILFLQIPGDNNRLTITVTGLHPIKGNLYLSLHNRAEYFQIPDSAFRKVIVAIDEETETIIFDMLPHGKYAIAIYHDANLSGELEVNELGIPKEGYGFSTKSKIAGKPKFEQAAFDLNREDTIEIKMIYLAGSNQN